MSSIWGWCAVRIWKEICVGYMELKMKRTKHGSRGQPSAGPEIKPATSIRWRSRDKWFVNETGANNNRGFEIALPRWAEPEGCNRRVSNCATARCARNNNLLLLLLVQSGMSFSTPVTACPTATAYLCCCLCQQCAEIQGTPSRIQTCYWNNFVVPLMACNVEVQ